MENFIKTHYKDFLIKNGWIKKNEICFYNLVNRPDYSELRKLIYSSDDPLNQFGRLGFPTLLPLDAIGIELGVAAGYFSDILLSLGNISRLYSIDAWGDHHDSSEYIQCISLLARHGTKNISMRMFFEDALIHFPNNYFDFIYIDAYAHTGQQDGKLLKDWYPKLKTGGFFSGHDYDIHAWPETVKSVDEFALSINKKIIIVPGIETNNIHDLHPSWYIIK